MMMLMTLPFSGLNLRNIIWHGFISEDEFQDFYTTFLFLLMVSLAAKINSTILYQHIRKRKLICLDQFPKEHYDFGLGSLIFPSTQTLSLPLVHILH
jgi:hypothetical protein